MTNSRSPKSSHGQSGNGAKKSEPATRTLMHSLLLSVPLSFKDKITTVKTAHAVDKSRFETAFKTLMKK